MGTWFVVAVTVAAAAAAAAAGLSVMVGKARKVTRVIRTPWAFGLRVTSPNCCKDT